MQFRSVTRIIGILLVLFSVLMLWPALIALIYRDGGGREFIKTFIVLLVLGSILVLPNRHQRDELKTKEGFLIVVLFWVVLGSVASLPFLFSRSLGMSITNAFFEAFSGLTTTGASVLTNIDSLPKAIIFYRSLLHWLGGMGIIVLAVAILPLLGVGGMQLYRAEIPGPLKDNKMHPRVAETAKTLWMIYVMLTVACTICFWGSGMTLFDAINYSFSIVSIGGFMPHDAGLNFYHSYLINDIAAIFLFLAGCNFALHFSAINGKGITAYWHDPEFRTYLMIQTIVMIICGLVLWRFNIFSSTSEIINQSFFHTVSMATTSGIMLTDITQWPLFLPLLLIVCSFIGGCAGSIGGGVKVVRILLLYLQGNSEIKRLIHPNAVYTIKLGGRALPEQIIDAVWGFFCVYGLIFIVSCMALMATGFDAYSAFIGSASALNNIGFGIGDLTNNFTNVSDSAKWIMILTMLCGRLEIFTLLVLFTPSFWRD